MVRVSRRAWVSWPVILPVRLITWPVGAVWLNALPSRCGQQSDACLFWAGETTGRPARPSITAESKDAPSGELARAGRI
ncbi:hypothetical protein SAMN05878503_10953 [Cereibacter ovatus]|uniref:Uncharacterized protein n=1 Tax=Cereibacter ovatus TaxID=439529 RepID=A0A285CUL9_9RHOB|nr:hypothetical protein SAMN05878503_10953 [Cereibacter ovatus]